MVPAERPWEFDTVLNTVKFVSESVFSDPTPGKQSHHPSNRLPSPVVGGPSHRDPSPFAVVVLRVMRMPNPIHSLVFSFIPLALTFLHSRFSYQSLVSITILPRFLLAGSATHTGTVRTPLPYCPMCWRSHSFSVLRSCVEGMLWRVRYLGVLLNCSCVAWTWCKKPSSIGRPSRPVFQCLAIGGCCSGRCGRCCCCCGCGCGCCR